MLTSEILTAAHCRHGFFTRQGGVSRGVYQSLNCGLGSGDDLDAVHENRSRVLHQILPEQGGLVTCFQIHSATVVPVQSPWAPMAAPEADAMVTDVPGIALGVLTADCAPVLFVAPGVVGAAHAGWRGAIAGILEATIDAMVALGSAKPEIRAAIGPTINQDSYQVGPDFPAAFVNQDPANAGFFAPSAQAGYHQFDLPGYVAQRLRRSGLAEVDECTADTYANADLFFSYRRSVHRCEAGYGRALSVVALTP